MSTKAEFDDYVGGDDRVDRVVQLCVKYGIEPRYSIYSDRVAIDIITAGGAPLKVGPNAHTFSLNLDTDTIDCMGSSSIDDGIAGLENVMTQWNRRDNDTGRFIEDMRSL